MTKTPFKRPLTNPKAKIFAAGFLFGFVIAWIAFASSLPAFLRSRLLSSNAPVWNWCPNGVISVENLETGRVMTDAEELRFACAARFEKKLDGPEKTDAFKAVFRAKNASGQVSFVEKSDRNAVFRVDGQVFQSIQLQENFERFR